MNPLDRNHDGKVNLKDLSGQNNIVAPGTSTTTTTTTSAGPAHMNPLDRNHDGRVDLKDLTGRPGVNQQGLAMNQGLGMNQGLAMNQGAHHNPLDRNHDGRVDVNDLTGRQGLNNQGLAMNQGLGMNPLDRNHDGRVDARDFAATGQTAYIQSSQRASLTRAEPTVMETIQKDVVIHERIHPVRKEEIQPIIYREREQLDVRQVTQMMHETQIQPTLIQQRELPAERREAIVERGAPIAENFIAPSREVDATMRTQVVHAPIVNEVIKKTIIEEIQPVLERDIIQSTVIQNTQPIYEKYIDAPTVYREVVTVQDRGIIGGDLAALEAQGFNLGATGRRLSQTYATSPVNQQGLGLNQGLGMNQGLAMNQGVHHNPLDRNHDGRVDMNDLTGRQGLNNQGLAMNQGLGMNQGLAGPEVLTHRGLQSGLTTGTHNPLDRNHDGRVDANDISGRQGLNNQGLGMNQGVHANPLDRNHDGKVDLKDLSGRQNTTTANRPVNIL